MGYTGDFVLARCDASLERLPVLGDPARCIEEFDEYLNVSAAARGPADAATRHGAPGQRRRSVAGRTGRRDRFARPDRERLRQRRLPRTRPRAVRRGMVRLPRPGDGRRLRDRRVAAARGRPAPGRAIRRGTSAGCSRGCPGPRRRSPTGPPRPVSPRTVRRCARCSPAGGPVRGGPRLPVDRRLRTAARPTRRRGPRGHRPPCAPRSPPR